MKIIYTCIAFFWYSSILAQVKDLKTSRTFQKVVSSRTIVTSVQSGFATANSSIKLEATNDGTKAVAHIAAPLKKNLSLTTFFFNVEQKVSGSSITKPLTLEGLSNGTSLNFGFQSILNRQKTILPNDDDRNAFSTRIGTADLRSKDIDSFSSADLSQLNASAFEINNVYVGAKLGFTKQAFDYLQDTIQFKRVNSDSRTGLNFSFTVGKLFKKGTVAASLGVKRVFEIGDPLTFAFPVQNTPVLLQQEYAVGAPSKKSDQTLRIEFMSIGNSERQNILRINPNINASFQSKRLSFEMPVFFLSHTDEDKKPNLNGGVFARYISDPKYDFKFNKSNWGLGLFIGGSITDLIE